MARRKRIYDPDLPLDPVTGKPPRGAYYPIRSVWFKFGTANYKAARKALQAERKARRNKQWKENAEREARGEFMYDPSLPFPLETQEEMHARGKHHPVFWRELYKKYAGK